MSRTDAQSSRLPQLEATIVRGDDGTDECTLHPAVPISGRLTTEWITASSGSFYSLAAWR